MLELNRFKYGRRYVVDVRNACALNLRTFANKYQCDEIKRTIENLKVSIIFEFAIGVDVFSRVISFAKSYYYSRATLGILMNINKQRGENARSI